MDRIPFQRMKGNRHIGNTPGLPKKVTKGRRKDMQVRKLLDEHNVTTVEALNKKIRNENRLKKNKQRTD